ncbi:MAG: RNA methyltransferase [Candidatus Coatesbacteria bacterium]|nr:RNA methyltransferase [Candidatus Coatesbacteria bacterium]
MVQKPDKSCIKPSLNIVLVSPRVADNIGAAARSCQNMGAKKLILVNPINHDSERARSVACNSSRFLESAEIYASLSDALKDATIVVGTSRRRRALEKREIILPEAFPHLFKEAKGKPIYIIFGTEDAGLTNDELDYCQYILTIPTTEKFKSLNLAQAVMLVAYQYFIENYEIKYDKGSDTDEAPLEEKERLYKEIVETMSKIGFFSRNKRKPLSLVRSLRKVFNNKPLTYYDLRTLHGLFTQMRRFINLRLWEKNDFPVLDYPEVRHRVQE